MLWYTKFTRVIFACHANCLRQLDYFNRLIKMSKSQDFMFKLISAFSDYLLVFHQA